jgi:hypothetical protein
MWADNVLSIINTPAAGMITISSIELAVRIFPTAKAWSLLIPVKYACVSVAAILTWTSGVLDAVIIAGNNVKDTPTPPKP